PSSTFSRTVAENRVASSKAMETISRRSWRVMSRTSTPSTRTLPPVTSNSRGTREIIVVFPQPVSPTSAIVSPGRTCRSTPSSTSVRGASLGRAGSRQAWSGVGSSGYSKCTSSKTRSPTTRSGRVGLAGSRSSFSVSSTSKYRSTAVFAYRVIETRWPSCSTGPFTTVAVAKNASRAPTLSWPSTTSHTPSRRQAPGTAAEQQAGTQDGFGDGGDGEGEPTEGAGLGQLGAAQLVGLGGEALVGLPAAAERLQHADAVHGLLHGVGQVAGLVLAEPGDAPEP